MPSGTYKFSVDWAADGLFTQTGDDITSFVQEAYWSYGRDYASQLTGRSIAGQCILLVKNSDKRFNSFNTSSPLSGNLVPGRKLKVEMTVSATTVTMWQGFLDSIEPFPEKGGVHKALLRFIGPLGLITQRKVNVAMQTSIGTGAAVGKVLDEAGWPAADRSVDAGQVTMNRWWTGGQVTALTALREIEETEPGHVREKKDGKIAFENRHFRMTSPQTTSQATFSDAAASTLKYTDIVQQDPLREIYNIIEAEIRRYTVGALATLWTLAESGANSPSITPGVSRDFWASFPNPDSATDAVAVDAWTTPVATTDFTGNSAADGTGTNLTSDIAVAVSKFDTAMKITLTNNGTSTAFITLLQARGTPVSVSDPVKAKSEDATSKTKYGERTYPVPGRWIPSYGQAFDYTGFIKGIYKDPVPVLSIIVSANRSTTHLEKVRDLDISQRITLTATGKAGLGINEDFFIEAERHSVRDAGKTHSVTYDISPASGYSGFFTLGTSLLGISTKLAY